MSGHERGFHRGGGLALAAGLPGLCLPWWAEAPAFAAHTHCAEYAANAASTAGGGHQVFVDRFCACPVLSAPQRVAADLETGEPPLAAQGLSSHPVPLAMALRIPPGAGFVPASNDLYLQTKRLRR